jgi:hypothetical protein
MIFATLGKETLVDFARPSFPQALSHQRIKRNSQFG